VTAEFKRLAPDDTSALARVAEDVFDHPIDEARARAFLADPLNILIVAIEDGVVVGQIQGKIHLHLDAPPDLFVDNLGVTPGRQRRGYARRLIALALDAGRARGAEEAWVLTERDNDAARAVYKISGAAHRDVAMFSFALTNSRALSQE
jgi:aminoglycoside 6'-N-acetyltransferase I